MKMGQQGDTAVRQPLTWKVCQNVPEAWLVCTSFFWCFFFVFCDKKFCFAFLKCFLVTEDRYCEQNQCHRLSWRRKRVINKFTDVRKNDLTPSCRRMTGKMKSVVKQQAPSAGEEIEHWKIHSIYGFCLAITHLHLVSIFVNGDV